MTESIRILYIAGWTRSGSTILGNILGQVQGFFHGGELWYVGERGREKNHLCGCGRPFRECPFWSEVFRDVSDRLPAEDLDLLRQVPGQIARTRQIASLTLSGRLATAPQVEDRLSHVLQLVYAKIQKVSHASVIVDSSKSPVYARMVGNLPGFELSVLHLVRDPRATGFSWLRRKFDPGGGQYLDRHSLALNSVMWLVWNATIEKWWRRAAPPRRYLRLRYEDFARDPEGAVQDALDLVGVSGAGLPFVNDREVVFGETHTVAGNPARLERGPISISADEEWRAKMPWRERAAVTCLTWPLLIRYGYPIGSG